MTSPSRILIIDDSAYNRTALTRLIESDPQFCVIGTAADGEEGLRKILAERPDIVTLDLDMPRMDGFTFLRIVMQKLALPIVVVSSQAAPENVFKALELGAVDFVAKPTRHASERINAIGPELLEKLRAAGRSQLRALTDAPRRGRVTPVTRKLAPPKALHGVVLVGASTGGPGALQAILSELPVLPVGILIAQHMPAGFTRTFAERLDRCCAYRVTEAQGGEEIVPGSVWVAPGGKNLMLRERSGSVQTVLADPAGERYVPCIDRLFMSAAPLFANRSLGIVLTGMGDDGAQGALAVRQAGGSVFAESEETAVVFGMPRETAKRAGAHRVLPLSDMPRAIEQWVRSLPQPHAGI